MSAVSSVFEYTRKPDQMDKVPDEEKKEFLYCLIKGIKDETITFEDGLMVITTPFGGIIPVLPGDVLFLVRKRNYPTFIMSVQPYFADELIAKYNKEEERDENRTYSISCV